MKVSELKVDNVIDYIRLTEVDEKDKKDIEDLYLPAAKSLVRNYTGLKDEAMDKYEDITIVVLMLCQDMYDNRMIYSGTDKLSMTMKTILDMYAVNFL